jgi:hypothetical protein
MAIDFTTPLGQVRLLTADLDTPALLSDEIVNGYLGLHDNNVYLAAADALDAMATSEVLLSRKIRTQDLNTDGPAVAAELRKQASYLRGKALLLLEESEGGFFEIVPLYDNSGLEGAERYLP